MILRVLCILHSLYYPDVRCFDDNDKPIKIDKNYLNGILSVVNESPRYLVHNPLTINDYTKILMGTEFSNPSINISFFEEKIYVSYIDYKPLYHVIYTLDDKMTVVDVRRIVRH